MRARDALYSVVEVAGGQAAISSMACGSARRDGTSVLARLGLPSWPPARASWADLTCRTTAELSPSVTKRRSGTRRTRRHDGIGGLPSEAGPLVLVCGSWHVSSPCSSVCSRDAMDRGSGARRPETPRLPVQDGCRTTWTAGTTMDDGRLTHNPEVAGSNPAPATNFRRSRPFPSEERAFCMPGAVVRNVVATGLYAAWQRDGGDGVTRDETAWTWWTLPPVIAGCFAQRYHRQPPTSSCPCWVQPERSP
jgi:hypothetical protein